ncbi:MAG: 4-hydroxy-tetrahydrodipicolinate synthase [Oscillospiraceae bacterium]|nr:4-hydroxy-tetrahydrodipicolinate synthase [Oscillospiraceae bacterium]
MGNKKRIFTGAGTAIITPFDKNGEIDYERYYELIEFQIKNNIDAIVVCGTTGEASTLTDDEHRKMIAVTVEKVNGRVKVIAGAGSNDTAYAVELSKHAEQAGADGILHVTPYYNKTTQKGLVKHFCAIADSVNTPIIVYNVPARTNLNILSATYKELSKHPNIVATKEAGGNMGEIIKIRQLCGDDLDIYSGNDQDNVPILSIGGIGVISVLSNLLPQETHDMCALYFAGKVKESADLQIKYMDLIDVLFCETSPIPVKTAMQLMNLDSGELRLPLCEMEEKNKNLLIDVMKKHVLI